MGALPLDPCDCSQSMRQCCARDPLGIPAARVGAIGAVPTLSTPPQVYPVGVRSVPEFCCLCPARTRVSARLGAVLTVWTPSRVYPVDVTSLQGNCCPPSLGDGEVVAHVVPAQSAAVYPPLGSGQVTVPAEVRRLSDRTRRGNKPGGPLRTPSPTART